MGFVKFVVYSLALYGAVCLYEDIREEERTSKAAEPVL